MGDFRITVDAVGGHGCQREVKDGGTVYGCGSNCPDCLAAEFVAKLARSGANVKSAALVHWPGQPSQVTDQFVVSGAAQTGRAKRERVGSF